MQLDTLASAAWRGVRSARGEAHRGSTILVVDDDMPFLELIGMLLQDERGYGVRTCTHGDEVLPLAASLQPGLVLLDLVLPGCGERALAALKHCPTTRHIPVIVVTAATLSTSKQLELIAEGAAEILAKPFDIDQLMDTVRQYALAGVPGGT